MGGRPVGILCEDGHHVRSRSKDCGEVKNNKRLNYRFYFVL